MYFSLVSTSVKEAEWLYHLDVRWGSCPAVAARASGCPGLMIRSCDSPAVKPEAVRSCASLLIPDSQECTGECCILLEPLFRISPEPPMSGKRRSPWVMPRAPQGNAALPRALPISSCAEDAIEQLELGLGPSLVFVLYPDCKQKVQ